MATDKRHGRVGKHPGAARRLSAVAIYHAPGLDHNNPNTSDLWGASIPSPVRGKSLEVTYRVASQPTGEKWKRSRPTLWYTSYDLYQQVLSLSFPCEDALLS